MRPARGTFLVMILGFHEGSRALYDSHGYKRRHEGSIWALGVVLQCIGRLGLRVLGFSTSRFGFGGFRVWGLGLSGFATQGLQCRVWALGFSLGVRGLESWHQALWR